MINVYLSGPIKGLTYEEAYRWREFTAEKLGPGFCALTPDYLRPDGETKDDPLSRQKIIFRRDRHDVLQRADALLVNLRGATSVSIGTIFEIAWADSRGIPIVVVMNPDGELHDHTFVREASTAIVGNGLEAISFLHYLFHKVPQWK